MTKNLISLRISVEPTYIQEQSDPAKQKYVWAYEVRIANESKEIIQLLNRYWRITDMTGSVEEVRGAGVVGLQPLIKPNKQFIYTSFCQLITPQGTMEGYYEIQDLEETHFKVEIPKFILSAPLSITQAFKAKLH